MKRLIGGALLLGGCTETAPVVPSPPVTVDSGTIGSITPPLTTSSTSTTSSSTEPFDCDSVPVVPVSVRELSAPRGYHDVAFDLDGNLIGSDNSTLFKASDDSSSSGWIPGLGMLQQFDWMPNGDLVVAKESDGTLRRITPGGGQTTIATDVYAYGVVVGPDEQIYAANNTTLQRIDPNTGERQVLFDPAGWFGGVRVLNFSPDLTQLYMGTSFGNGDVYVVDLDANLDPTGSVRVLAGGVGQGNYHDSLAVDLCGYLYVADYDTRALYRVSPEGQVQDLLGHMGNAYGHGAEWGRGIGPWRDDALYLPQPYDGNTVLEVVIGVPTGRSW